MLFDSDIMIWVLRGRDRAAEVVQAEMQRAISLMTYLEIVQGVIDRVELDLAQSLLMEHRISIIALNERIGQRAAGYMEQYTLSHGLGANDAIIAATAVEMGEVLCTGNVKHFRPIKGLELKAFRP